MNTWEILVEIRDLIVALIAVFVLTLAAFTLGVLEVRCDKNLEIHRDRCYIALGWTG